MANEMFNPGNLAALRRQNTFGSEQMPRAATPPIQPVQPAQEPMLTPAMDRLNELMNNFPEMKSPNFLSKVAASMMALRDPKMAMDMLNQPSQEMQNWQSQIGPAQQMATQERLSQLGQGNLDVSRGNLDLRERGFEQGVTENTEDQAYRTAQQKIASAVANKGTIKERLNEDGTMSWISINPLTNEITDLGTQSGMSPSKIAEINNKYRVDAAELSNARRIDAAELASTRSVTAADRRATERTDRQEEVDQARLDAAALPGTTSPSQKKVAEESLARRLMDENKDLRDADIFDFTDEGVRIKTAEEIRATNWWGVGKDKAELLAEATTLRKRATKLLRGGGSVEVVEETIDPGRQAAIDRLTADERPITETTIKWMMDQLK